MFAIVVAEGGGPAWRRAFAHREVEIGSHPRCDVVLPHAQVAAFHARLVARDGKYILVDLEGQGTFVRGKPVANPVVIREHDPITIGPYALHVVTLDYETVDGARVIARDATEQQLLDAIARGDDASRGVYADWLEERGDPARAEFLRVQQALVACAPEGEAFAPLADRLRELASTIDVAWRSRVARPPIEGCPVAFEVACPRRWSALAPTATEGVRYCGACRQEVHYCATIDEARALAASGQCVAIDIASPRWDGDLAEPFGERVCAACDLDVGTGLRDCPRCGHALPAGSDAMVFVGRMA